MVVEDVVKNGTRIPGNKIGTWEHIGDGVRAIM